MAGLLQGRQGDPGHAPKSPQFKPLCGIPGEGAVWGQGGTQGGEPGAEGDDSPWPCCYGKAAGGWAAAQSCPLGHG